MPEPAELTPDVELVTLRKVNAELLQAKHTLKAKVTSLEADVLAATEKADKAQAAARAVIVDQPLKRMVSELSKDVPELVMRELLADFKFEAGDDGSILITNIADGKPIAAKNGKAVAFDKHSLHLFLIGDNYAEKSDRQRVYTHLLGVPAGSGGVGRMAGILARQSKPSEEKKEQAPSFGLR